MSDQQLKERVRELEADNRRLRHMLDQRGMPAQLRHQIRNTLAIIRAIVRRSMEGAQSVEDYAAHLEGRVDAILRVQSLITRERSPGIDLHSLVSNELLAHLALEGEQVRIAGPTLQLQPKPAEVLGLALHELTINAVQYGALTTPEGRIAVTWEAVPGPDNANVNLVWLETGVTGLQPPSSQGFGMDVLQRMLRYELKAEAILAFQPDSLRCSIRFPLPASVGVVLPADLDEERSDEGNSQDA